MTKLALAKRIASIVVYGHILLFAFGLIVMLVGPYDKEDTAQMLLMGSPLLAMVALSNRSHPPSWGASDRLGYYWQPGRCHGRRGNVMIGLPVAGAAGLAEAESFVRPIGEGRLSRRDEPPLRRRLSGGLRAARGWRAAAGSPGRRRSGRRHRPMDRRFAGGRFR